MISRGVSYSTHNLDQELSLPKLPASIMALSVPFCTVTCCARGRKDLSHLRTQFVVLKIDSKMVRTGRCPYGTRMILSDGSETYSILSSFAMMIWTPPVRSDPVLCILCPARIIFLIELRISKQGCYSTGPYE